MLLLVFLRFKFNREISPKYKEKSLKMKFPKILRKILDLE